MVTYSNNVRSAMKAMWVLLVVCVVGCGETPVGGGDVAPDMPKVDAIDVVADLTGEVGPDTTPLDTIDTTPQPDTLDALDTVPLTDTLDALDTVPQSDTIDTVNTDIPCTLDCDGKECGDDGCGGICGECEPWFICQENGLCYPDDTPDCTGKECGPDGFGGSCGTCPNGEVCTPEGQCVECQPQCGDKECGDDGCGGSCGACDDGDPCTVDSCAVSGACVHEPGACADVLVLSGDVPIEANYLLIVQAFADCFLLGVDGRCGAFDTTGIDYAISADDLVQWLCDNKDTLGPSFSTPDALDAASDVMGCGLFDTLDLTLSLGITPGLWSVECFQYSSTAFQDANGKEIVVDLCTEM